MQRVKQRLRLVVPLTLCPDLLLLYLNTRSLAKTMIVLLAVPFSAVGAIWFLYLAGYNMSVAVWVGLIALLGIDAETGVFMLLYLDLAYEEASGAKAACALWPICARPSWMAPAKRLRPKFMTFATTCIGLFPIMWATGTGSDVMKRIAAPMVGGIFTSFLLELLVYPAIYEIWRWHGAGEAAGAARERTPIAGRCELGRAAAARRMNSPASSHCPVLGGVFLGHCFAAAVALPAAQKHDRRSTVFRGGYHDFFRGGGDHTHGTSPRASHSAVS